MCGRVHVPIVFISTPNHKAGDGGSKKRRLQLLPSSSAEEEEGVGFQQTLVLRRLERQLEEERLLRKADAERAALRLKEAEAETERLKRQVR